MNEMVERVAKALEPFFSSADIAYKEHVQAARAAIEAMMVPTEAMKEAPGNAFVFAGDYIMHAGEAEAAWKAMIQSALTEGTER